MARASRRTLTAIAFWTFALAAACGDSSLTLSEPSNDTPTAQREVGCGEYKYPRRALDGPTGAERHPHPASEVLRQQIELSSGAEMTPTSEWRLLRMDRDRVVFGGGSYKKRGSLVAELAVERAGDDWRLRNIKFGCGLHVYTGSQVLVDFAVAPGTIPAPTSLAVDLLIKDRNCGGQEVLARLNDPLIEYSAESVGVLLTARPNPGMHTCQGFPPSEYRLELSEPLGDRTLMDVGSYPPFPPGDAEDLR